MYLESGWVTGVPYRQRLGFVFLFRVRASPAHTRPFVQLIVFPWEWSAPRTALSRLAFICSFVSVRRQNISSPCVTVCVMLYSKLALIVRLLSVIFGNESYSKISIHVCQGCTYPERQVARATKYFRLTANILGSLV